VGAHVEDIFSSRLGLPTTVVNDADAAGYAELGFGSGSGENERGVVFMVTFGTGIGTAMFVDGILVSSFWPCTHPHIAGTCGGSVALALLSRGRVHPDRPPHAAFPWQHGVGVDSRQCRVDASFVRLWQVPNLELGHIELDGKEAEHAAAGVLSGEGAVDLGAVGGQGDLVPLLHRAPLLAHALRKCASWSCLPLWQSSHLRPSVPWVPCQVALLGTSAASKAGFLAASLVLVS